MLSNREKVVLGVLIILAAAVRLYRLDWQGIWFDEAFTIYSAALDFGHFRFAMAGDPYPPLYNFLIWLWIKVAGAGEYEVRLISVVFGVATVPILYALARRLFGVPQAVLASAMLVVSQFLVQYSQEARSYSMLCFLIVLTTWFYVRACDDGKGANWISMAVCAGAALWTHYYGLFPLLALAAHWILFRRDTRLTWRHWAVISLIAFGPFLVWAMLVPLSGPPRLNAVAQEEGTRLRLASLLGALNRFHNGKPLGLETTSPAWTLPVGFVLFTAPALWGFWRVWRTRHSDARAFRSVMLITLLTSFPMILSTAASEFGIMFAYRYWIPAVVPYYMLTAFGILSIPFRALRYGVIMLLFGLGVWALRTNYYVPYRQTFRDGWNYFFAKYSPNDCAATAPLRWRSNPPWSWYTYAAGRPYPRPIDSPEQLDTKTCEVVWYFRDKDWFLERRNRQPDAVEERLAASYTLVDSQLFSALEVKKYRRQVRGSE